MPTVTIVLAVLLILIAAVGYIGTGSQHPTALIPAVVGVLLGVCGLVARSADTRRRALFMHIAVTLGLLGFLGTAKSLYDAALLAGGHATGKPAAIEEKAAMSLLCLIFVVLCVRSFIAARRARA